MLDKLEIAIDRDSVESYLENSAAHRDFATRLVGAGFEVKERFSPSDSAALIRTVKACKLKTLRDIDEVIRRGLENFSYYESLAAALPSSMRQRSLSRAAAVRLAIIRDVTKPVARKILSRVKFKQALQDQLEAINR